MLTSKTRGFIVAFVVLASLLGGYSLIFSEGKEGAANSSVNLNGNHFSGLQIIQDTTLLPSASPSPEIKQRNFRKLKVIVTAYSSSICETQGDPFITASGHRVRDGIVANNLLPFGTKIRLPAIFGNKTFVVEDRMNSTKGDYHVDIWFSSRKSALEFGAKLAEMEIISEPPRRS